MLSVTFTQTSNANLYHVIKCPLYLSLTVVIISTPKLVVSRNLLSIKIVLSCFYLIFYFEKFATRI